MSVRAAYVAALRVERENLARRAEGSSAVKRRLGEVDAQLAGFADEPQEAVVETAVPGRPVTGARTKAAKAAPKTPAK